MQQQLQASANAPARGGGGKDSGISAGEFHSLKDAVVAMMSDIKGIDMEKKQLELKAEHERQLIALERKFQRRLMEARRKSEGLIESLRQTYEDEVDSLKTQRNELVVQC